MFFHGCCYSTAAHTEPGCELCACVCVRHVFSCFCWLFSVSSRDLDSQKRAVPVPLHDPSVSLAVNLTKNLKCAENTARAEALEESRASD